MAAGGETCRCEVLFFAGSSSLVVEISYKLQIENRAEQFRASDEAPRRAAATSAIGRPFLLTYTSPTFHFFEPRLKARKASGISYLHSRQRLLTARQLRERAAAIVFQWVTYGTVGPW
jgi:hypothetical protein